MFNPMRGVLAAVVFCAPIGSALAGEIAPAPQFLSHRAVYELKLTKAFGNKAPNSADGRIAFDFSGAPCDGYVQNYRQTIEIQPSEGPARFTDLRAATFEGGDFKNFRFKMETDIDGGKQDVDGTAAKSGDGALSVSLSAPKTSKLDLDRDVLFPTEHLMHIIEAARAGKPILEVKVYDGTETGEKVFETLTVIGKPLDAPAAEAAAHASQLQGVRRWPVTISYFEENKKDSPPSYVMSFDLYENGVSRALKLDYGDFVLAGEMTKFEALPAHECKK